MLQIHHMTKTKKKSNEKKKEIENKSKMTLGHLKSQKA